MLFCLNYDIVSVSKVGFPYVSLSLVTAVMI